MPKPDLSILREIGSYFEAQGLEKHAKSLKRDFRDLNYDEEHAKSLMKRFKMGSNFESESSSLSHDDTSVTKSSSSSSCSPSDSSSSSSDSDSSVIEHTKGTSDKQKRITFRSSSFKFSDSENTDSKAKFYDSKSSSDRSSDADQGKKVKVPGTDGLKNSDLGSPTSDNSSSDSSSSDSSSSDSSSSDSSSSDSSSSDSSSSDSSSSDSSSSKSSSLDSSSLDTLSSGSSSSDGSSSENLSSESSSLDSSSCSESESSDLKRAGSVSEVKSKCGKKISCKASGMKSVENIETTNSNGKSILEVKIGVDTNSDDGKRHYFSRIDRSKVSFEDAALQNNTYQGAAGTWGEKANDKLSTVRGKDFTKNKNKMKKGGYRGGSIILNASGSYKFKD